MASEFRYRSPIMDEQSLVIIISQSGETADSLAALRLCKERGVKTLAIVNVVGSSIARELVVGIATQPDLFEKVMSNMVEVRSRGAYLFGLTTYGQYAIEDIVNFTVYVPRTEKLFSTSLAIIPLQLLAYYISCAKGLDVDKPRNLAKSVTVE